MLSGFDSSLVSRLREAEEAEQELLRLQPVAEEAPKLRLEKAKAQKRLAEARTRAKSGDWFPDTRNTTAKLAPEFRSFFLILITRTSFLATAIFAPNDTKRSAIHANSH